MLRTTTNEVSGLKLDTTTLVDDCVDQFPPWVVILQNIDTSWSSR